jgi:glutathione S-transferase
MADRYIHHGWDVSPFSAKTRAYLHFKQIPFDDVHPTALGLWRLQRAVGRMIMPCVQRPDGSWMQDTSEIIDELEGVFPDRPITPPTPRQQVASFLLELHGDEWLSILSIHHRWNNPTNAAFARDEFAREALPWLPRRLGRRMIRPVADKMASYRRVLGISPDTIEGIERFTDALIAQLENHLARHPFLLGTRPCLGDFAMYAALWAHVHRDPGTTHRFDAAPHVVAWFERLRCPDGAPGAFLPDDEVPETLDPLFNTLFREHFAHVVDLLRAIDGWVVEHPEATRVPRSLGDHPFEIGGARGTRRLITFTGWMAQRPLDAYRSLDDAGRASVDAWLARFDARGALDLDLGHRQVREGFRLALAR